MIFFIVVLIYNKGLCSCIYIYVFTYMLAIAVYTAEPNWLTFLIIFFNTIFFIILLYFASKTSCMCYKHIWWRYFTLLTYSWYNRTFNSGFKSGFRCAELRAVTGNDCLILHRFITRDCAIIANKEAIKYLLNCAALREIVLNCFAKGFPSKNIQEWKWLEAISVDLT